MAKRSKSKSPPSRKRAVKRTGVLQSRQTNRAMEQANALIPRIVALLTRGQAQQAWVLIETGMRLVPDHPEFAHLAGQIIRGPTQADKEAARRWLRRAVDLAPQNAQYAVSLSYALLGDNELEQALQWARHAVRVDARFADAYTAIGLALVKLGRRREAVDAFSNALRLQPSNPDLWKNLALCRMELGDVQGVHDAVSQLEQHIDAPSAALLIELGEIYRGLYQLSIARRYLQKATEKDPLSSEAWFRLATVLGDIGSLDAATEALAHAEHLDYHLGSVRLVEGFLLSRQRRVEDAKCKLEEALQLDKDNAHQVLKIAAEFSRMRDLDAQMRCLNRVVEIDPQSDSEKVRLEFGFAKVYDQQRDYDRAFESFANANALSRKQADFESNSIEKRFRPLFDYYAKKPIGAAPDVGYADPTPIIIAGTSRSGKSLTERLLCLHEPIAPRGEAGVFVQLMQNLQARPKTPAYPEMVDQMPAETAQWLGQEYVSQLRAGDSRNAHLTDTHPSNIDYIGLLRHCLPEAKILVCRREPKDACVSMYTTCYTHGHHYSEDLYDLGRFWSLHEQLLDLWCELFPTSVYQVSFERLIRSPEQEARDLMAFCNISVGQEFFERVRAIANDPLRWPRADDVIGVWKPYEAHLGPLFSGLKAYGKERVFDGRAND